MSDYTVRPISDRSFMTRKSWQHKRSTFRAAWGVTEKSLLAEVRHLRGRFLVIECDVTDSDIRLDGRLRANARPSSPAVRVAFEAQVHDLGDLAYATDVFSTWQDNVRAIALGLRALRQVDRYAITQNSEQYRGFKAITAFGEGRDAAAETLELIAIGDEGDARMATLQRIKVHPAFARKVWLEARKVAHPDVNGGDRKLWDQVETAARVLGLDANGGR